MKRTYNSIKSRSGYRYLQMRGESHFEIQYIITYKQKDEKGGKKTQLTHEWVKNDL